MLIKQLQSKWSRPVLATVAATLVYLLVTILIHNPASAASFDPGRIIDNSKFTNKDAMNAGDIQNFLNSKVPTCDTYHAPGSGAQGSNPPWICLKDYNEGGRNAANIINDAAKAYSINPQVLLVTLQKENGLITDSWPYPWQYRTAMGFGCPDGAPCDAQWFGFTNQVNQAARHFRNFYDNNPNWFVPFTPGVRSIKWSPNAACGSSNVNIVNQATAALYSYTPYQPNAAALNNLYGTGDGCSSYGNRNFWRDYTNWFGSTIDDPYRWEYAGQSTTNAVVVGQKATWTVSAKNIGSNTWYNSGANPVMLGTSNSRDRASAFCTATWFGCGRPAKLNEASVAPGAIGTFTFAVQAPTSAGNYNEYFNLVAEGAAWMNDPGLYFGTPVGGASFGSSVVSNNFPGTLAVNGTANTAIVIKNTGTTYWYNTGKYPVNLGTFSPADRASSFATNTWMSPSRPAKMTEDTVAPGQNGTFSFTIKAPTNANIYQESFSLVADGWAWFNQPITSAINVGNYTPPPPPAQIVGVLSANQTLTANQALSSPDGRYKLVMQSDGNLVLYSPNRAIWSTGTHGKPANLFVVQSDSNLVLYGPPSSAYWNSGTQGRGGNILIMQNDGNLVLYNSQGRPVWHTSTAGRI